MRSLANVAPMPAGTRNGRPVSGGYRRGASGPARGRPATPEEYDKQLAVYRILRDHNHTVGSAAEALHIDDETAHHFEHRRTGTVCMPPEMPGDQKAAPPEPAGAEEQAAPAVAAADPVAEPAGPRPRRCRTCRYMTNTTGHRVACGDEP